VEDSLTMAEEKINELHWPEYSKLTEIINKLRPEIDKLKLQLKQQQEFLLNYFQAGKFE
jgi:hypothetical protein